MLKPTTFANLLQAPFHQDNFPAQCQKYNLFDTFKSFRTVSILTFILETYYQTGENAYGVVRACVFYENAKKNRNDLMHWG